MKFVFLGIIVCFSYVKRWCKLDYRIESSVRTSSSCLVSDSVSNVPSVIETNHASDPTLIRHI